MLKKPVILFCIIWFMVIGLYQVHLSELLIYDAFKFYNLFFVIFSFFLFSSFFSFILIKSVAKKIKFNKGKKYSLNNKILERYLRIFFIFWVVATVGEIIYTRGVPLYWLAVGSLRTYADFGIPTIHGLMNSLILVISLLGFFLYLQDNKVKNLLYVLICFCAGIILVTRHLIVVNFLQILCCYFTFKRVNFKKIIKVVFIFFLLVYFFGLLGDYRSGAENFLSVARPSQYYPHWLPSGFLWVYIYLTTPLNNLFYSLMQVTPSYDFSFQNTLNEFLPSLLKMLLYSDTIPKDNVTLVSNAFNVRTAFISPYLDFGFIGIAIYTFILGFVAQATWTIKSLKSKLIYCVFFQIIILSIFYNHLFSLPVIFQIFWINLLISCSTKKVQII